MTRRIFALTYILATGLLAIPVNADPPSSGTGLTVAGASATVSLYAPSVFISFEHIYEGSVGFEGTGSSRTMTWSVELPAPGGLFNDPARGFRVWITRPGSSSFSGGTFSFYQFAGATLGTIGYVQAIAAGPAGAVVAERSTAGVKTETGSGSMEVPAGEIKIDVQGYHSLYLHVEP